MSTLRDQIDDSPKMAWIWATESIKNCVNGKHEPQEVTFVELRPFERICRHCKVYYKSDVK